MKLGAGGRAYSQAGGVVGSAVPAELVNVGPQV